MEFVQKQVTLPDGLVDFRLFGGDGGGAHPHVIFVSLTQGQKTAIVQTLQDIRILFIGRVCERWPEKRFHLNSMTTLWRTDLYLCTLWWAETRVYPPACPIPGPSPASGLSFDSPRPEFLWTWAEGGSPPPQCCPPTPYSTWTDHPWICSWSKRPVCLRKAQDLLLYVS